MSNQDNCAGSRSKNGGGGDGFNDNSSASHYRRCHICNEVSEVEIGTVKRCKSCGKAMAPFFFFEERETPIVSVSALRPAFRAGQHPPVCGLTAYW